MKNKILATIVMMSLLTMMPFAVADHSSDHDDTSSFLLVGADEQEEIEDEPEAPQAPQPEQIVHYNTRRSSVWDKVGNQGARARGERVDRAKDANAVGAVKQHRLDKVRYSQRVLGQMEAEAQRSFYQDQDVIDLRSAQRVLSPDAIRPKFDFLTRSRAGSTLAREHDSRIESGYRTSKAKLREIYANRDVKSTGFRTGGGEANAWLRDEYGRHEIRRTVPLESVRESGYDFAARQSRSASINPRWAEVKGGDVDDRAKPKKNSKSAIGQVAKHILEKSRVVNAYKDTIEAQKSFYLADLEDPNQLGGTVLLRNDE